MVACNFLLTIIKTERIVTIGFNGYDLPRDCYETVNGALFPLRDNSNAIIADISYYFMLAC